MMPTMNNRNRLTAVFSVHCIIINFVFAVVIKGNNNSAPKIPSSTRTPAFESLYFMTGARTCLRPNNLRSSRHVHDTSIITLYNSGLCYIIEIGFPFLSRVGHSV
ncbi:hypothetical protein GGR51DRAFT_464139 [Nemania sp. FL0031]|nr:hypothetical protein GGR51DRAFT_464139 [Nemania sp. FL0031]